MVIAKARFAIQDMWALYFASLGGYKYDEHIRIRQLNIRGNLKNIRKSQLLKTGVFLFACGISCWYGLGRVIKYIKKIK